MTQELLPLLQKVNSDSLKILVTKRYPQLLDKKSTFQQKQKAMGALYRKGFSLDDIRSIS
jgi:SOS response regulatory protein OraA/RecX